MAKGAKAVAKAKAAGVAASTGKSRKAAADEPFSGHEGLGPHQIEAVKAYQGFEYRSINDFLRGERPSILPDTAKHIPVLDWVTNQATINRDMTLYRGFKTGLTDPMDYVGKTISDNSFASTSMSREKAEGFGSLVIEFRAPKGTKGLAVHKVDTGSVYNEPGPGNEQEVLLPRGSKLKILSVKKDPMSGKYHAQAELSR